MVRPRSYLAPLSLFVISAVGACSGDPTCADLATCAATADAGADGAGGNSSTDGAPTEPDGGRDGGNAGPTLSGTGNPKWATRFGATYSDFVHAVAIDGSGDVYATGGFNVRGSAGPVDFGGACGKRDGFASGFIARFSGADGSCKWLKIIGRSDMVASGLALTLDSTTPSTPIVLVAGYAVPGDSFNEWRYDLREVKTPIGGVREVIYAPRSAFLLRVSGIDGSLLEGFAGPSNAASEAYGVGFDPVLKKIVLCGKYADGSLHLDYENSSAALFPHSASEAGFVLELDATTWTKDWEVAILGGSAGTPTPARATSCTFDNQHRTVVAGTFGASGVTVRGSSPLVSKGDSDGFVANLASADGAVVWATRFGSTKDDAVNGLRIGSDDSVYVAGSFGSGDGDFSSIPFVGGAHDAFLGRMTPGGSVNLLRGYGSPEDDLGTSVASGPNQEIVLTGFFGAAATIGDQKVAGALPREPFALKTDPNGTLVWARGFGTLTTPTPTADQSVGFAGGVAIAANGDIALGGAFVGNLQFDKAKLSSGGTYDAFVAKLAP